MSENFADLFEESLHEINMTPGAIVTGTAAALTGTLRPCVPSWRVAGTSSSMAVAFTGALLGFGWRTR